MSLTAIWFGAGATVAVLQAALLWRTACSSLTNRKSVSSGELDGRRQCCSPGHPSIGVWEQLLALPLLRLFVIAALLVTAALNGCILPAASGWGIGFAVSGAYLLAEGRP